MSTPASQLPRHPIHKQIALDISTNFTYGDQFTHDWLKSEFGITYPLTGTKKTFDKLNIEYMFCIEGLKEELLLTYTMKLISVYGVGFKIIMPNEHSEEAMSVLKTKVSKEIKRAVKTLLYTNDRLLTQTEIQEKDGNVGKIAALTAFSKNRLS